MSTMPLKDSPRKAAREVQAMFGSIAARYDAANTVLSLGIHHYWRKQLFREISGKIKLGLDLCTGTGDLLPTLAARCETVFGADFCSPMLKVARRRFPECNLIQGDGLQLPFKSDSFDLVTVSFGVRNFEKLEAGLREIARVLKRDGQLIILEFGQPTLPGFAMLFNLYSRFLMPLIGGAISGNIRAYSYLPKTSAEFPCREALCRVLEESGYDVIIWKPLTFGIAYLYSVKKR